MTADRDERLPRVQANADSRERLRKLAESLTSDVMPIRLRYGWTLSIAFAHLAFWDSYALALVTRWERTGFGVSGVDVEAINDALRPILETVSGVDAGRLALHAAEAVDQAIERLSPDLAAEIEAGGRIRIINRSLHRNEHLDEIERALENRKPA